VVGVVAGAHGRSRPSATSRVTARSRSLSSQSGSLEEYAS
jgi:hypothetical protein